MAIVAVCPEPTRLAPIIHIHPCGFGELEISQRSARIAINELAVA